MKRIAPGPALAALIAAIATTAAASGTVAFDAPGLQAPDTLQVSVSGVQDGGAMPIGYTADGRNTSPPIGWSAGPPRTKSYVVLMQDPDAHTPEPAVHWLVYGIPATVTSLSKGMRNTPSPDKPLGSAQGANFHGSIGYSGPRPPPGDLAHHYHLQVFALDRPARVRPGADLAAVERVMQGHVVARGELVATYVTAPPKTPKTTKTPAQ